MNKILTLIAAVSTLVLSSCACCKAKKEAASCCADGKASACCAPGAKSECKECDMGAKH